MTPSIAFGMPAIAAIAREAARLRDPRDLLIEIETEHERAAKYAAALVAGAASVATISNSSLVERVLGRARPDRIVVGDRWRRVAGPTPAVWSEPELFEPVSAARNVCVVDGRGPSQGRPDLPE